MSGFSKMDKNVKNVENEINDLEHQVHKAMHELESKNTQFFSNKYQTEGQNSPP
jgi:peptidoglycan hydrolase CwlO-like protein